MNQNEFQQRVNLHSSQEDYAANEHLLEVIQPAHYKDFLNCLISGMKIKAAFKGLDMILYVAKTLRFDTVTVIKMIHEFRDNPMVKLPEFETA